MSKCNQCIFGYCDNCSSENCECTHALVESVESTEDNSENESEGPEDNEEGNWRARGAGVRRYKREAAIKDAESTGRKRAARLYPLDRTAHCEWLGKQSMGGGSKPINGCPTERACRQQARHHGPDKNTLNNEQGNVHRIGHLCHNRWHAANDPDYDFEGLHKGD